MKKLIFISTILFLFPLKAQNSFQFSQTITVDDGVGNHYDLTFGFSPDYTDGYDEGYCSDGLYYITTEQCEGGYCFDTQYDNEEDCEGNDWTWYPPTGNTWTSLDRHAPPAPPAGTFDAALAWDNVRYYKQIVAGLDEDVGVEHVWDISLQYAENNLINITWDNTGWSDLGTFVLQDAFGGVFINVNMVDGSGLVSGTFASLDTSDPSHPVLSIFNPAINTLKLMVTPNGNSSQILAGFTADVTEGEAPLTVTFSDQSTAENTEIASWDWDFGDENTSTEQNPTHTYAGVGNYTVNLTVSDETGVIRDTETVENFITVIATPTAGFTYINNYLNVSFTDTSVAGGGATIIGRLWDFGDETTTSTEQNPVHTYAAAGTYTVSLTVTSEYGSDSVTQIITVEEYTATGPSAGFGYSTNFLEVIFTDISVAGDGAIVARAWDFGDGGTSDQQNPTHTYAEAGTYQVSLTVTDENSLNSTHSEDLIVEARPPTAGFTYTENYLNVSFTDASTPGDGAIVAWAWDFGDNSTSTEQNPVHTYTAPGTYQVSLTVTDENSESDTYTENVIVVDPVGPTAGFTYTENYLNVSFTDASTPGDGAIITWAWDFDGDGVEDASGTGPHTYIYTEAGTYTVSLTVESIYGSSSATEIITVEEYTAEDNAPIIGDIPNQTINAGQSFTTFDLDDYLTELDGDEVVWSYDIIGDVIWPGCDDGIDNDGDGLTDLQDPDCWEGGMGEFYLPNCNDGIDNDEDGLTDLYDPDCQLSAGGTGEFPPPLYNGPTADFTYTTNFLEATFTDVSTPGDGAIITWAWDFGDGEASDQQNPTHTYAEEGLNIIILTVTDEFGLTDTHNDTILLFQQIEPTAGFTYTTNFLEATFTDVSTPGDGAINNWSWNFGDGTDTSYTEYTPSITHTYTEGGTFTIILTVTNEYYDISDSVTQDITVEEYTAEGPNALFAYTTDFLEVAFTDISTSYGDADITAWAWDFGDGTTSTEQNPTHTYSAPDTYTVSLTVTDENSLSHSHSENITVEASPPTAGFTYVINFLEVTFTDISVEGDGEINSWNWDFGDGNTSTEQYPVHTYSAPSTYTISLIVTDANDLNDTYTVVIVVVSPIGPTAGYIYATNLFEVTFTDISVPGDGEIIEWSWDFGDGNSSTQQNPEHTYSSEGLYNVILTVTDANSLSDSHSKQVMLGINFTATVNVSGDGNDQDLIFGFSPLSTDGFDASYCMGPQGNTLPYTSRTSCLSGPNDSGEFGECPNCGVPPQVTLNGCEINGCEWVSIHTWVFGDSYAPPGPPPPSFDAALFWEGERYYTQILYGPLSDVGEEHVYDIVLAFPANNLITITWDNTGWSDLGTFVLQDAFGGVMFNVDMNSQNSLELNNPAFNTLKLKVTPSGSSGRTQSRDLSVDIDENNVVTITYPPGWTGSEEIIFRATDQTEAGLSASDNAVFSVDETVPPESGTISGVVTFSGTWPDTGTVSISLHTAWPPISAPYAFMTILSDDLNQDSEYSYSFEYVAFGTYGSIVVSWLDPTDSSPATNQHVLGAYGGTMSYDFWDASSVTVSEIEYELIGIDFDADLDLVEWVDINFEPAPIIQSIDDVPNDQGGKVFVDFLRSSYDTDGLTRVESYQIEVYDEDQWVGVATQNAYNDSTYRVLVNTISDSSSSSDGVYNYRVIAGMEEGNFVSETATGYSVDNIAPGVPEGLSALASAEGIILNWLPNSEEDFQYYGIYRSTNPGFEPDTIAYETADTDYVDIDVSVGTDYYYRISAFDYSGNESEYSAQAGDIYLAVDNASLVPEQFALHHNHPNPFNPITSLRYDLPEQAQVTFTIYDLMGREITQLINTTQEPGFKSVQWNATDMHGNPVSAGVYLYQIQAGEFMKTKKMVLLK